MLQANAHSVNSKGNKCVRHSKINPNFSMVKLYVNSIFEKLGVLYEFNSRPIIIIAVMFTLSNVANISKKS